MADETMQQVIAQESIEQRYNRKHIDTKIQHELETSLVVMSKVNEGVQLLTEYLDKDYYASKNSRLAMVKELDLHDLVFQLFVGVAYFTEPELLSSAAAQLASRLRFSDKVAAITTLAEILAVLCATDVFNITKADKQASLMVQSCINFDEELMEFIQNSRYLPPMVCLPLELTDNYSSGYLTHKDGLVLGKANNHSGDLCLDVLNTMNKVALSLNTDFISKVEEEPTFDLVTTEQMHQWHKFKTQSYATYLTLVRNGNCFYLTHKVDMRGRIYGQGWHVNTEGVGFKKASVELCNKEIVSGSF